MATTPPEVKSPAARPHLTPVAACVLALAACAPAWAQRTLLPPAKSATAQQDDFSLVETPAPPPDESAPPARRWNIEPGLAGVFTQTSNSTYGLPGESHRSDSIAVVSPLIRISGEGRHARVNGQYQLDRITYLRNTRDDRFLPSGSLDGQVILIDQFLGIDGSLITQQTADAFTAQGVGVTTGAGYTTTQARVSPFLSRTFGADWEARARSDLMQTHFDKGKNDSLAHRPDAYDVRHTAAVERKPLPLGVAIEGDFERSGSKREDDEPISALDATTLTKAGARAVVSYALTEQVLLGGIVGRENYKIAGQGTPETEEDGVVRGVRVDWRPSPRTRLSGTFERHFFGPGWDAALSHRTTTFTTDVRLRREVTTSAAIPLGLTATTSDLAFLSVQLRQSASARFGVLLSRRDKVSLNLETAKTTPWDGLRSPSPTAEPIEQRALELEYKHRLTRVTNLETALRWNRNSTPGAAVRRESDETSLRVELNSRLSPHTIASVGLRYQTLDSTVVEDDHETALFVGLGHRF